MMVLISGKVNTLHILLCTVQDDGVTAIPVFAPICTAPVFDDGRTDIVFDCNASANVPGSSSAK